MQRGESGESGDAHTPSFFGFVAQDEDPGLPSARGEEEEEDMRLTLSPGHISRMPESAAPIVHHFRVRSSPPRIQTLSEHATPSPPRDSASRGTDSSSSPVDMPRSVRTLERHPSHDRVPRQATPSTAPSSLSSSSSPSRNSSAVALIPTTPPLESQRLPSLVPRPDDRQAPRRA